MIRMFQEAAILPTGSTLGVQPKGKELHMLITKFFFKEESFLILLYDIHNKHSFDIQINQNYLGQS